MTPAQRKAVEDRFGLAFPDDWATWDPDTERDFVRGVAALFPPEAYVAGDGGEVIIGETTEGGEIAFVRGTDQRRLRSGIYDLGAGKRRKLVAQFSDLLLRARRTPPRPDEQLYEQRVMWAALRLGEWRICPTCGREGRRRTCECGTSVDATAAVASKSEEQVARAREAMPNLFAAIDFVLRWRTDLRWLDDFGSVLGLETARERRLGLDVVVERWIDRYGISRSELPIDELRVLLEPG